MKHILLILFTLLALTACHSTKNVENFSHTSVDSTLMKADSVNSYSATSVMSDFMVSFDSLDVWVYDCQEQHDSTCSLTPVKAIHLTAKKGTASRGVKVETTTALTAASKSELVIKADSEETNKVKKDTIAIINPDFLSLIFVVVISFTLCVFFYCKHK